MRRLLLLFRGGRSWQEDAKLVIPHAKSAGAFLAAGIALWFVTLLTAGHHLLAGPLHIALVLVFAILLVMLSGYGKGARGDIHQLRALLSIFRLRLHAPLWQQVVLRVACIVLGVRRKDG